MSGVPSSPRPSAARDCRTSSGRGVVVADSASALTDAIAGLLVDPARAAALGRIGHDAVEADHTWNAALAPLLEVVRPC